MKNDLLKNTLVVAAGKILSQFATILLIPLYTFFLTPGEYGIGDLLITYAVLALPFVTLGLEQGAFRLLVDSRDNDKEKTKVLSYTVKTSLLLFTLIAAVALTIGPIFFDFSIVILAVVYAFCAIAAGSSLWFARGLGDNKGYAMSGVVTGVAALAISIPAIAWLGLGLYGMVGSLAVAKLLGAVYLIARLKLYKYISFKKSSRDPKINKEMLRYSLPLIPNSISWWLVNSIDRTVIVLVLGAAATGVYGVALKFPAILIGLTTIFWIAWHESASLHINSKDKDQFFTRVFNTSFVLFGTVGLLILAGLSLVFDFIVGKEFSEAYLYIPILMTGALFSAMSTLYGSIYAAKKKTTLILTTTILAAVVNVALLVIFIHYIGLFAAAIASLLGYFAMFLYRFIDTRKYVSVHINWGRVGLLALLASVVITAYYVNIPALNAINVVFIVLSGYLLNKSVLSSAKELVWKKFKKS